MTPPKERFFFFAGTIRIFKPASPLAIPGSPDSKDQIQQIPISSTYRSSSGYFEPEKALKEAIDKLMIIPGCRTALDIMNFKQINKGQFNVFQPKTQESEGNDG